MSMRYTAVSANILDAIHDTPLLEVEGIFAKCEFLNPSGSIKARIAKYMIEKAEAEGRLKPGDTIVEATSGNTGNALSLVAAVKGYRMVVVMPEGLSSERVAISRAYGAVRVKVGTMLGAISESIVGAETIRAYGVARRTQRRIDDAGGDASAVPECEIVRNAKFGAIQNFTQFIRPGDSLIATDSADATAAVDADGLTLVYRNDDDQPREVSVDLSRFGQVAESATVQPFTTTAGTEANPTANAIVPGEVTGVNGTAIWSFG